jgi:hypothetical protein
MVERTCMIRSSEQVNSLPTTAVGTLGTSILLFCKGQNAKLYHYLLALGNPTLFHQVYMSNSGNILFWKKCHVCQLIFSLLQVCCHESMKAGLHHLSRLGIKELTQPMHWTCFRNA